MLLVSCLALLTFFCFLPTLENGFTNWDDPSYIIDNSLIRDLSFSGIKEMFSLVHRHLYKPLTFLSFALEYYFFKLNPFFYHLDNLLLHLINCLLVFWLIFLLSKRGSVSFLAALLFAIHPLHVESVAWATERKDVLYALFFLGSSIGYLYYVEKKRRGRYYLSLGLFFLSLLSKPMAFTLPLVLFTFDYLKQRKRELWLLAEKIPFFILAFISAGLTFYAQSVDRGRPVLNLESSLVASRGIVFYLEKTVLPLGLCAFYPYPQGKAEIFSFPFLLSFAGLIILLAAVILSLRYTRKAAFGAAFFLLTLLPVLQLVYGSRVFAADRYSYIPLIGVFYLIAEASCWLYRQATAKAKAIEVMIIIALVFSLVSLTRSRSRVWKDGLTLWNDVLKRYPRSALAYINRSSANIRAGNLLAALTDCDKAIGLSPLNPIAYLNRGYVFARRRDFKQAIADYSRAIEIDPAFISAHSNRAGLYQEQGQLDRALSDYNTAIKLNPLCPNLYFFRAKVHLRLGNKQEALADYQRLIQLTPADSEAVRELKQALETYLTRTADPDS